MASVMACVLCGCGGTAGSRFDDDNCPDSPAAFVRGLGASGGAQIDFDVLHKTSDDDDDDDDDGMFDDDDEAILDEALRRASESIAQHHVDFAKASAGQSEPGYAAQNRPCSSAGRVGPLAFQ
jgi:hypothetical protein